MTSLVTIISLRQLVDDVCEAIDAGLIQPPEEDMITLATACARHGGLLAHDMLVKLASRCAAGKAALREFVQ